MIWTDAAIATVRAALTEGLTASQVVTRLWEVHRMPTLNAIGFGGLNPHVRKSQKRKEPAAKRASPSPLVGEGARRADEGLAGNQCRTGRSQGTPHPTSGFALGHLLPQGEKAEAAPPPSLIPPSLDPAAYDSASRRVPLERLGAGCKWPVNDAAKGEAHLFCGQGRSGDGPYCAHHAARARRPRSDGRW